MCLIDADSVLEEHALTRAVLPFLENSTTVAVGGIVRIGNGCVIEGARDRCACAAQLLATSDHRMSARISGRPGGAVGDSMRCSSSRVRSASSGVTWCSRPAAGGGYGR